jgi:nucleoside-triphosphatase THEP1
VAPKTCQSITKTQPAFHDIKGIIRDRSHRTLISGRPGSGKTTLLLKLLKNEWRGVYHRIVLVCPTFAAQFKGTWDAIHPDGLTVYTELDEALLKRLHAECIEHAKKGEHTLVIIDDCGSALRKLEITFGLFVANSRHCKCSVVHCVQKVTQTTTLFRSSCDCLLVFGATSHNDKEALFREVSTVPRAEFFELFALATQEKHGFMACCVQPGGVMQYFRPDLKTPLVLPSRLQL